MKTRCPWVNPKNALYVKYHDQEWGRAVHDDRKHFEMLTLEGAQAGLSWETVLKKRENYRKAFAGFDPRKVAGFAKSKVTVLMKDEGIIRNRLKIESTIGNAKAFLAVQKEFGSFDKYVWSFVGGKQLKNKRRSLKDYPTHSPESDALSKDLKKRGFRFVGSTIMYAYMQAIGMVDDHSLNCFRRQ
jgi:DNA-3-methyladenine glycosylase I